MRVLLKKRFMFSIDNKLNLGNKFLLLILVIILFSFVVFSHAEDEVGESEDLGETLKSTSANYIMIASIIVGILILFAIYNKDRDEKTKIFLFVGIVIPIILATVYSAGSTIYLNLISETQGPVHWHADYEVWNCGEKIDLINPTGLSNRVGNPVFHEHGDDRIHVEGVVTEKNNVDLHNFFNVIGGILSNNYITMPTDNEIVELRNGDLCNGEEGKLQVFLYKIKNPDATKNWIFEQQKLENFEDYILSPYSQIPPGDCIIIEFDAEKEKTEHICETYKTTMQRGELNGG